MTVTFIQNDIVSLAHFDVSKILDLSAALDETKTIDVNTALDVSTQPDAFHPTEKPIEKAKPFAWLGPGLITGASDDDPSGIGTYSMAGAAFGYSLLWLAPLTYPLMTSVQITCAKIAMVTGTGLTPIIRKNFPRIILYPAVFALVFANALNAGSDIAAIAAAIQLLIPVPTAVVVVLVALAILALQLFGSYKTIAALFKWMALALLTYVAAAFFVKVDYMQVLRGTFMPTVQCNGHFFSMVVAILGTTISPYLFFWQADQEVEEKIKSGKRGLWRRRGTDAAALKARALDVKIGMLFANLVMFFIMLVTGSTLFPAGAHQIASCTDAAAALRPLAGPFASLLFAFGIIGSGFLAVPVLTTSGAYALAQAFGMRHGLHRPVSRAKGFYTIIVLSTVFGLLINCLGIDPMKALFFSAVVNGLLAPPLLVLIMLIANSKKIMGDNRIDPIHKILGWTATAVMFVAAFGMFLVQS